MKGNPTNDTLPSEPGDPLTYSDKGAGSGRGMALARDPTLNFCPSSARNLYNGMCYFML